jgi:hypothetical protein
MPSRILRDSALTSYSLDQLSGDAERLWWRLTAVADDHGRFNADPRVVCAMCFPIRAVGMDPEQVATWLDELERIDGIRRYEVGGHRFGYFVQWTKYQRPPRYRSKFPPPPGRPNPADNSGSAADFSGCTADRVLGIENSNRVLGIEDDRSQPPTAAVSRRPKTLLHSQRSERAIPSVEQTKHILRRLQEHKNP